MTETTPAHSDPFAARRRGVAVVLGALLLAVMAVSMGMGSVDIAPRDVARVVLWRLGVETGVEPGFTADAVVWDIRLPRIVLGIIAGGGLAVAGAALQGLFRNPLADPHLLGIGPGAALGGVIGTIAGGSTGGVAGGAVGGLLAAMLVRRLGGGGIPEPSRFILTGVALGAALSAWVGFVVFAADRTRVPPVDFWLLGGLSGSTWRVVGTTVIVVLVSCGGLVLASRTLDLMTLGETEARHLGVDVDLATTVILMAVGLATGAATGAVGVVAFVGLLAPHFVRPLTGPAHRPLLVASALAGAFLVVGADLVARTVADPIEIPVGLVTAAIGGPFFLWLLRRRMQGVAG
ncbi:MAG TPA: iron ABC transporter permease [Acidimicrobiia bacterium]|nr:iron ABC transporter permease [Acidimicrobiia bacterium]